MRRALVIGSCLVACSARTQPEVSAADRARGAEVVAALKKSLVGALQAALPRGPAAAVAACHDMAPALAASLARDGVVVGRATRKPRNPANEARGWQSDALAELESKRATVFTRRLPDGRIAYAEPLLIQELCLTCHGTNLAPEVRAMIAEKYPTDRATGYQIGDLRGLAWVELPTR